MDQPLYQLKHNYWLQVRNDVDSAMVLLARRLGWLSPAAALQHIHADASSKRALARDLFEQVELSPSSSTVDIEMFKELMTEAVAVRKGVPRTYLLPNPHARHADENLTFQPAINANTDSLAAKRRPEGRPTYELLHEEANVFRVRYPSTVNKILPLHQSSRIENKVWLDCRNDRYIQSKHPSQFFLNL